jgi:hypothetical protein
MRTESEIGKKELLRKLRARVVNHTGRVFCEYAGEEAKVGVELAFKSSERLIKWIERHILIDEE